MNIVLTSLSLALLLVGCREADVDDSRGRTEIIDQSKLKIRKGVTYLLPDETPFTGRGAGFYESEQKKWECSFKDGLQDGLWIFWHENGQKIEEINYKDGKYDGHCIFYNEGGNGQKEREVNYKSNKPVTAIHWKPNGEKCPVTNLKDGNGVVVSYNKDGTESSRTAYKDGERVD
tara:strand:+ start:318 stop:842 length:525 start_codon:yes stop_codon:yes gene_type:complete